MAMLLLVTNSMAIPADGLLSYLRSDDLLPYPRSEIPTGRDGPIFVVSETAIAAKPDQVTLETLAGVLARRSPASL